MNDLSPRIQISIRLPAELVADYDRIAAALERDRSWVLLRALRRYLDEEGAEILADAEGLAAIERGEVFDFDDVMAEAYAIIEEAEARKKP